MKYSHLLPIFILALLGSFAFASYRPILPVYVRILGGGGLLVGLLSSSFMLARALSASIFGRLSDILNRGTPFIRIGLSLFFFTTLLFLFAKSYPPILILVTLQGFISGMIWPQAQTLIARGAHRSYRSRAFSLYFISGNTGMLLSSGAVGFGLSFLAKRGIEEPYSYRYIFAGIGVFFLFAFFLSFALSEFKKERVEEEREEKIRLPFSLLLGIVLGNGIVMGLFRSILLIYLYDRFGFSSKGIAYILFFSQIGGLLLIYIVSHISDVKGLKWGLFLTQIPLSLSCILLPWFRTPLEVIVAMTLLIFGIRAFNPISRSLASLNRKIGTRIGFVNAASNIGAVIGPLIGGLVYDIAGIERPFMALGIFPLVGVGISVLLLTSLILRKKV